MSLQVELLDDAGRPVRVKAAQLLVRNANGTPITVVGEYAGAVLVSYAGEPDFVKSLELFGYGRHQLDCVDLSSLNPVTDDKP